MNGKLKVYAIRNGIESRYDVKSPIEAKKIIFDMAMSDLHNPNIDYNMFGLLVCYGSKEEDWFNEDGEDINGAFTEEEQVWLKEYKELTGF